MAPAVSPTTPSYFSDADVRSAGCQILLDPRLKGKIGALNDMQTRVWYAALQSRQNPNAIADMDEVWAKTRESRSVVLKYWDSGRELMNLLGKEEIFITDAYSGRVAAMQKQGFPIGYYNPPGRLPGSTTFSSSRAPRWPSAKRCSTSCWSPECRHRGRRG
jgi:spermidine/putrescine transport system substrate-binding protein